MLLGIATTMQPKTSHLDHKVCSPTSIPSHLHCDLTAQSSTLRLDVLVTGMTLGLISLTIMGMTMSLTTTQDLEWDGMAAMSLFVMNLEFPPIFQISS